MTVEESVAELYGALYDLRTKGMYQEEYDAMDTLIRVLQEDMKLLLAKHGDKINSK